MKVDDVNNGNELRLLEQRLAYLEKETRALREKGKTQPGVRHRRRFGGVPRAVIGVLAAVVVVAGLGTVYAANGDCPNGYPFCFSAKTPAKASEVNHNFSAIKEWVEQKVGTVGTADVTVQASVSSPGRLHISTATNDLYLLPQGQTVVGNDWGGSGNLVVHGTATVGALSTAGAVNAGSVSATGNVGAGSVSTTGTVTAVDVDASGTVYAGLHLHTCAVSGYDIQDCACPAGYQVLGGGAACQVGFLFESRPISNTTWRVRCAFGENHEWPKTILGMTLICARVDN